MLALAPVLVATAVRAGGEEPVPQAAAWPALTAVPVAALLLAHHRDTLPVTLPGPCAPAPLAAGVVVGVVRPAVPQPGPESWFRLWTGPVGLGVLGLAAGAVVCVAPRTRAPWLLALAGLAALLVVVRLLDLSDAYGSFLTTGVVQAVILAAVAVTLGLSGRRALP